MKQKYLFKLLLKIIVLALFVVLVTEHLYEKTKTQEYAAMQMEEMYFRSYFLSDELLEIHDKLSVECKNTLDKVENEAIYYPVAESNVDKSLKTSYINSWMSERSFGGKRGHEGVDIMASVNERGIYPVVSITDGVITNLGWLEKGGYRVGITTESGTYYYYAHLESYSNIREGDSVRAGDLLGYMGDSGYGEEGTTGKFDVHLHLGIYCYENGKEISLNPYYLLKRLENNKLKYAYS